MAQILAMKHEYRLGIGLKLPKGSQTHSIMYMVIIESVNTKDHDSIV